MTAQPKRMTLRAVAERAGVSAPTISKVLNGRPDVAPETRERVLQVLRDEQYVPRGASSLPMANKHVELVFDALLNPNNIEMLRGVLGAATPDGVRVAVSTVPSDVAAAQWVNELMRVGRAGLIIVTSRLSVEQQERLEDAELPVVLIDPITTLTRPLPSVGTSNWQGGLSAVQYLIDLGHRRIAMLRGYESLVDDARYHGYLAALSGAGVAPDPELVARADFRFDPAVPIATRMLQAQNPPTAIFASNDLEALAAIEAARRLGLRVPEDLSVVGFDDSLYARASSPSLTSVRQPFEQVGEVAYGVLRDLMQGREPTSLRVELAATLVIRDSATAPPGAASLTES